MQINGLVLIINDRMWLFVDVDLFDVPARHDGVVSLCHG